MGRHYGANCDFDVDNCPVRISCAVSDPTFCCIQVLTMKSLKAAEPVPITVKDIHRAALKMYDTRPINGGTESDAAGDGMLPHASLDGIVRLLLLDLTPATIQKIENALWVWPHRISLAGDVRSAIEIGKNENPDALIMTADASDRQARVRQEFPDAAIIVVTRDTDAAHMQKLYAKGADLVLQLDDLQRPTLYDLVVRAKPRSRGTDTNALVEHTGMPIPWSCSRMLGCIVCDVSGSIIAANRHLANTLGYASVARLTEKNVPVDILAMRSSWTTWKSVAGDTAAYLHLSESLRTQHGERLNAQVELFAAPHWPSKIQAVFVF